MQYLLFCDYFHVEMEVLIYFLKLKIKESKIEKNKIQVKPEMFPAQEVGSACSDWALILWEWPFRIFVLQPHESIFPRCCNQASTVSEIYPSHN